MFTFGGRLFLCLYSVDYVLTEPTSFTFTFISMTHWWWSIIINCLLHQMKHLCMNKRLRDIYIFTKVKNFGIPLAIFPIFVLKYVQRKIRKWKRIKATEENSLRNWRLCLALLARRKTLVATWNFIYLNHPQLSIDKHTTNVMLYSTVHFFHYKERLVWKVKYQKYHIRYYIREIISKEFRKQK